MREGSWIALLALSALGGCCCRRPCCPPTPGDSAAAGVREKKNTGACVYVAGDKTLCNELPDKTWCDLLKGKWFPDGQCPQTTPPSPPPPIPPRPAR